MYPLLVLLLLGGPVAQGQIMIQPDGDVVNIVISGVSQLSAFEFRLSFDENALEAIDVSRGSSWQDVFYLWHPGAIFSGTTNYTSGAASDGLSPLGVDGTLHVATIQFRIKGPGDLSVSLVDVLLANIDGDEISPAIINASFTPGNTLPKPVPR